MILRIRINFNSTPIARAKDGRQLILTFILNFT